jgi:tRNA A-37 threonylcarbamoyl transferase component Bud32
MIGKTLKHYEVEKLLGKGGMGVVYRARDVRLDRPVALKILKPELTADPDKKKRFLQEARSASAVTHPAIAQIYDVDEVEGKAFMVMEFVEGKTVSQLITDRELDLVGSVEIALQVADGLGQAHKANIVHRDIKSDNIMVTRDGHTKLLDFGLAKLLDPTGDMGSWTNIQNLTHTKTLPQTMEGTVMGTVAYMSPEQARGQAINLSSDVFSLGIVIYEMVTGELPFKGESPLDTLHAIAFDEVRPVTVVRQNLPPEVHRIVTRCLRKRPEDRYQDAGHLAADLKHLKREIETGVQTAISAGQKVQQMLGWMETSIPFGIKGIVGAVIIIALLGFLIFTNIHWSILGGTVVLGLLVYRYIRNRKNRMVKRFVTKVSKFPDVKAITYIDSLLTVIVEKAQAKLYIRINSLIDSMNKKLYFGESLKAAVRDDLSEEDFHRILRAPGVLYVRDDVILES